MSNIYFVDEADLKKESNKNKTYIIAEAGINHNGDIDIAKKLIKMAKNCGCNCVKFQKRTPHICVPENQKKKEKVVPWRTLPTTYLQYKEDIEFGKEEYDILFAYAKSLNIHMTCSVWDIPSLDFIKQYAPPFIKIPSALLTDDELLLACKNIGLPIYLSTGMSTEEEIDHAVEILGKSLEVLFHCNSSYPAKDNELNLAYIVMLKLKYPYLKIGYSGHEEGISACLVAKVMGAEVFERHITLSRSMWGTDQAASLVFDQLHKLRRDLDKVNEWIGFPIKKIYPSEKIIRNKLRGN